MLQLILGLCMGAWLMSVGVAKSTERPCFIGDVNGCSVPFGLDIPFKEQFTVACDKHDVCYACGSDKKYSLSQSRCDDLFLSNMKKICKGLKEKDCEEYAELFYSAVRGFGEFFFKKRPKQWCTHTKVPQCISGSM